MILVDRLSIRNGEFRLDDVSFEVPSSGYGVLMGKTGSGKTTILEAITGLKPVEDQVITEAVAKLYETGELA